MENTQENDSATVTMYEPCHVFGSKGKGPGDFLCPSYVAVCPKTGNIVISDAGNNRVQVFDVCGQFKSQFGTSGTEEGEFDLGIWHNTGGISVNSDGHIVVADTNNDRVQVFTDSGQIVRTFGSTGWELGDFRHPRGLTTDSRGLIYVCDEGNRRIQVLREDGKPISEFGTVQVMGDWLVSGVAVCPNGDVVAADSDGKLDVFSSNWHYKGKLKMGGSDHVILHGPRDVCVDPSGRIIVSDHDKDVVHVMTQGGDHVTSVGGVCQPVGVACTREGGIIVVERETSKVKIFNIF